jgi:ubiquinone/menaquinone biosynthesis C-methylase UbiE
MSLLLSNMVKFKRYLRNFPILYNVLQLNYYRLLYLGEKLLGSEFHKWIWKNQDAPDFEQLKQEMSHPHRNFLVTHILKNAPFEKVLEVGCNSGQNLFLLAQKDARSSFYGVDINYRFIQAGQEWCKQYGFQNVFLKIGKAEDLSQFIDQSFDITFSDATLMYIGPDKIIQALEEIIRITQKRIIFNEWGKKSTSFEEKSCWYDFHWVHDYGELIKNIIPNAKIKECKLPAGQWLSGGGWEKYGTYIEVEL